MGLLPYISLSETYLSYYYLKEKNITVECHGTPHIKPYCVNTKNSTQIFDEETLFEIEKPLATDLALDEHSDRNRNLMMAPPPLFQKKKTIINNLVLLIEFPEHRNANRIRFPREVYEKLFNADDKNQTYYPTGSVKSFYQNQTYNKINLQSTILPWFQTNITEKETTAKCSSLCFQSKLSNVIIQALTYFDNQKMVEFKDFDSDNNGFVDLLTVITSSRGAESGWVDDLGATNTERVWSHRWSLFQTFQPKNSPGMKVSSYNVNPSLFGLSGNTITRIGVLTHEIAHMFDLPDTYDTDGSSAGLHVYDLMASSWGIDGSQLYPPSFTPWGKERLGVIRNFKKLKPGINEIKPSNLLPSSDNEMYKLELNDNEAIYIDYQIPINNMKLHPEGVLIYHCDNSVRFGNTREWYPELYETQENEYPKGLHYLCRLIQADNKFKLEKTQWPVRRDVDVYFGITNSTTLNDSGKNNINSWANLEKKYDGNCVRSGHQLWNFTKVSTHKFVFYYRFDEKVAGTPCEKTDEQPTGHPTSLPTNYPTNFPTEQTNFPTKKPTNFPSQQQVKCGKIRRDYFSSQIDCQKKGKELCTHEDLKDKQIKKCGIFWIKDDERQVKSCNNDRTVAWRYKRNQFTCRKFRNKYKYICC